MIKEFFTNLFTSSALNLINCSYYILLFACMISIVLYAAGLRKAGKYITVTFVVHFLLQSFKIVLK